MSSTRPRGVYGIDAPWVPWMLVGFTVAYTVLTLLVAVLWRARPLTIVVLALVTVMMAASAAVLISVIPLAFNTAPATTKILQVVISEINIPKLLSIRILLIPLFFMNGIPYLYQRFSFISSTS